MRLVRLLIKYLLLLLLLTVPLFFIWRVSSGTYPPHAELQYSRLTKDVQYVHLLETLPASDYNTLMNISDFYFLTLQECSCHPLLLVVVNSAPEHFAWRQSIRSTWGRHRHSVKVVFMLGMQTSTAFSRLWQENQRHRDMVVGKLVDSYKNLTYKHVMGLKYAIYHCPGAKYVLKVDDDVFVNMPAVMALLKCQLSPYGCENLMMCPGNFNLNVVPEGVPFEEYNQSVYPTYCLGWAVLYSSDVVFKLYKHAQCTRYFWMEDVFITGVVAKKANVIPTDVADRVLPRDVFTIMSVGNYNVPKDFLYGPMRSHMNMYKLWNLTNGS